MPGWGAEIGGIDEVTDGLDAAIGGPETASYTVGSDVEYAVYVEFGTTHMPANGALRNAVSETMSNFDMVAAGAGDTDEIIKNLAESIMAKWRADVWVDTGRLRDSIEVRKI